ncbi:hypothetical protein OUQ99_28290 [Streptomonospora nanhaiensis]|uniref:Uncharacterized protein n=1 Tax=Streptomonospora nanhaiensis TaxID=1323731 RepID=A0ABY6YKX7_9ACTN|nr:hypothetical protein [Streptomonospora nanhaiensis]WAE73019.1 hypothetical protein OUQ99_28290 [Streptomonospora nanhaiensis]
MRQFSAAALTPAFRLVTALFIAPRGRHASPGLLRRRRSTRVRRYAPVPVPAPVAAPDTATAAAPTPGTPPRPVRDLAPPRHTCEAGDVALVRPYYEAHERESERERALLRVQAEASARLHGWVPRPRTSGDLLAAPSPLPLAAYGPPVPLAGTATPETWDDLAAATHGWGGRRARQGVPA